MRRSPKQSTLVVNKDNGLKTNVLQTVTINLLPSYTYDTLEGRQYMVVPMVMLTEGVHSGSAGPLYYPESELAKTPEVWNHKPIVVYHPMINGVGVSACDRDILDNRKIGIILGARYEDGKLHAEAWLERPRVEKVDNRILEALDNNQMMELSTGLFSDNQTVETTEWNGEEYTTIATNYRPDHLAILPDQKGACSLEDGGGLNRNEASHEHLRDMLRGKLRENFGKDADVWVEAVFDKFFIYSNGAKLYKQNYTATDIEVTFEDTPVEVVRVAEFRTLDGLFVGNIKETFSMNKKEVVDGLIKNGSWEEGDREFLMSCSEPQLNKMVANTAPKKEPEPKKPTGNTDPKPEKEPDPKKPIVNKDDPKPVSVRDYISNAPPEVQDFLGSAMRAHEDQKKGLVAKILANKNCQWTEVQLNSKDLQELNAVAAFMPQEPAVNAVPTYAGLADAFSTPAVNLSGGTLKAEEPMAVPTLNFQKDSK